MFLTACFFFFFPFLERHSNDLGILGYDRPLKVPKRQAEYAQYLKERLLKEEGNKKKVEAQLETQGVEMEGAQAELTVA